jgi:molybdopterin molybdotransferase
MQKGEDIGKGSRVLGSGVKLGPQQIGLLASLGIDRLPVIKPYRVGIISTGDEIIPVDQKPAYGQIRDVNSYAVGTAVEACGCLPHYYPIIKDDFSSLQQAVGAALRKMIY